MVRDVSVVAVGDDVLRGGALDCGPLGSFTAQSNSAVQCLGQYPVCVGVIHGDRRPVGQEDSRRTVVPSGGESQQALPKLWVIRGCDDAGLLVDDGKGAVSQETALDYQSAE